MKKAISVLLAMVVSMPFVMAGVSIGDRISAYDDEDALVGDRGYIDVSTWNGYADVYVCATKDGNVKSYGMNLRHNGQVGRAIELVKFLAKQSFQRYDHFGCLRARI